MHAKHTDTHSKQKIQQQLFEHENEKQKGIINNTKLYTV